MNKTFTYALTKTLHHEGGLVDHPADPGGRTYRGLSQRFLTRIGLTVDDILAEESLVAKVYYENFWLPCRCDEIQSELIAGKLFDMAVNMGQRRAVKLVQSSIVNIVVDGAIGPKTLHAINTLSLVDYTVLDKIRKAQADYYLALIKKRPSLGVFELGWLRRAVQ